MNLSEKLISPFRRRERASHEVAAASLARERENLTRKRRGPRMSSDNNKNRPSTLKVALNNTELRLQQNEDNTNCTTASNPTGSTTWSMSSRQCLARDDSSFNNNNLAKSELCKRNNDTHNDQLVHTHRPLQASTVASHDDECCQDDDGEEEEEEDRSRRGRRKNSLLLAKTRRRSQELNKTMTMIFCYSSTAASLLLLLLTFCSQATNFGYGAKLPDIYWNSSNPM